MLTQEGCLARQKRLRERLSAQNLDAAVLTHYLEIYYFTGILLPQRFPACLFLSTEGGSRLVSHSGPSAPNVDESLVYAWHKGYTMNPDLIGQLSRVVGTRFPGAGNVRRLGWQAESMPRLLAETIDRKGSVRDWVAIDDTLNELQKRKDPDEVELLRKSAKCSLAAYTAVQAAIQPGVNELEVLAAGQRAAMLEAGEPVYHDGDYQCGQMGGPARHRRTEKGETYIVDAWTIYRGYWSDLCRTYMVGDEPSDLQRSVFEHLKAFHDRVPSLLRPGRDGTEIFEAAEAHIRAHPALKDAGLPHHAGHSVGLRAHQMPDMNRDRGGVFEVGNVVSVEPGAYIPGLRGGVRLENAYLIGEEKTENLSDYPMELVPRRC
jgi:Xaa-Pro aminopeptidase